MRSSCACCLTGFWPVYNTTPHCFRLPRLLTSYQTLSYHFCTLFTGQHRAWYSIGLFDMINNSLRLAIFRSYLMIHIVDVTVQEDHVKAFVYLIHLCPRLLQDTLAYHCFLMNHQDDGARQLL